MVNNTLFVGKVFFSEKSLDSTNQFALNLIAKSNPSEGTVISAYEQRAGKGQYGREWNAQAGKNLTLSIILYPNFLQAKQQFLLSQAIALGVKDFCEQILPNEVIKIKWPNDLFINGKKVGGILIQNGLRGATIKSAVVGVGININQMDFPSSIPNVTSFQKISTIEYNLADLIPSFCKAIEIRYLQIKGKNKRNIHNEYENALFRKEENVSFELKDIGMIEGVIIGVEETGELKLWRNNKIEQFNLGQLKMKI